MQSCLWLSKGSMRRNCTHITAEWTAAKNDWQHKNGSPSEWCNWVRLGGNRGPLLIFFKSHLNFSEHTKRSETFNVHILNMFFIILSHVCWPTRGRKSLGVTAPIRFPLMYLSIRGTRNVNRSAFKTVQHVSHVHTCFSVFGLYNRLQGQTHPFTHWTHWQGPCVHSGVRSVIMSALWRHECKGGVSCWWTGL